MAKGRFGRWKGNRGFKPMARRLAAKAPKRYDWIAFASACEFITDIPEEPVCPVKATFLLVAHELVESKYSGSCLVKRILGGVRARHRWANPVESLNATMVTRWALCREKSLTSGPGGQVYNWFEFPAGTTSSDYVDGGYTWLRESFDGRHGYGTSGGLSGTITAPAHTTIGDNYDVQINSHLVCCPMVEGVSPGVTTTICAATCTEPQHSHSVPSHTFQTPAVESVVDLTQDEGQVSAPSWKWHSFATRRSIRLDKDDLLAVEFQWANVTPGGAQPDQTDFYFSGRSLIEF